MIRQQLAAWVQQAALAAQAAGALELETLPEFEIETPRNPQFGDFATNLAMLLARQARRNPREVAEILRQYLPAESHEWVERVEVAGAGFLNFYLKPSWAGEVVRHILAQGMRYGSLNLGAGKRVLIEFVSANPTGPLTLGHGRNAAVGDALARLYEAAGYTVEREFYINDGENSLQIRNFALSVLTRYRQLLGESVPMPEDAYHGEYVKEIAQRIRMQYGDSFAEGDPETVLKRFAQIAKQQMLHEQERDLAAFGVRFDRWFSEQSLYDSGSVQATLDALRARGYAYEHEGALWLKSTAFGDEKDRVLVRANGMPTYLAADVAYHRDKYERGYDLMIDLWGADHHGYVARMRAAMAALGYDPNRLQILIYQLVNLFRGAEPVRMSKRAGEFITLREVMDEIGVDALRFFYLLRSHESTLDIDIELAQEQSEKNPVFYVQYAHARICSIERTAAERGVSIPDPATTDLSGLTHVAEVALIKRLADLPEEIALAVKHDAPHRLTAYALDVARAFHSFYTECRVLDAEPALQGARLLLTQATRLTLARTLQLLGVSAPERMEREAP
ncbi:MAG: arginine--tRNA ligase [Armatimonadetes bacterium JP3_11]|nr:MAG: arginine--tRNA ligase [Armatimonadetes bacterium JP3_11]RMH09706.1 MAG: arginine--tRNA ligase [Armatimonadota bacterium]